MERIFEAETREEANRKADEWWAHAKAVRFTGGDKALLKAAQDLMKKDIVQLGLFGRAKSALTIEDLKEMIAKAESPSSSSSK